MSLTICGDGAEYSSLDLDTNHTDGLCCVDRKLYALYRKPLIQHVRRLHGLLGCHRTLLRTHWSRRSLTLSLTLLKLLVGPGCQNMTHDP